MGEYYNWVNVDKKEYLCPGDFGFGNKRTESLVRGSSLLCALREMIFTKWSGDHLIFMGDETPVFQEADNEALRILYRHSVEAGFPGEPFDTVCETYRNVSALFRVAEQEVRKEIRFYVRDARCGKSQLQNTFGVDLNEPFAGLFLKTGKDFRYTINHTKKVYYAFGETKILYLDHTECGYADPLPLLMAYGRATVTGAWVGDIVAVSDDIPKGYELLQEIYLDW